MGISWGNNGYEYIQKTSYGCNIGGLRTGMMVNSTGRVAPALNDIITYNIYLTSTNLSTGQHYS